MNKIPFYKVNDGQLFVWMNWVHRKISADTSIAVGYAASNSMDDDTEVLIFNDEELEALKSS